jgi:hypothetical protein
MGAAETRSALPFTSSHARLNPNSTPTISNYAMSPATTQTHSLPINLTTNARIYNLPTRITSLAFLSYKQPNPTQLPPTPSMRMHILISSLSLYIRARLHPRVSSQGPKSHTTHLPGASCRASSHWAPNTTRRRKKRYMYVFMLVDVHCACIRGKLQQTPGCV